MPLDLHAFLYGRAPLAEWAQFYGAGLSPAPFSVCCRFNLIARGSRGLSLRGRGSRICRKDEGTLDNRRRDGGTNFILRIKEQETCLTLQEHDDNDDGKIKKE